MMERRSKAKSPFVLALVVATCFSVGAIKTRAQLESGISTFTGDVPAHCTFVDFPSTVEYEFTGSRLQANAYFGVMANGPVSLMASPMTMVREPPVPGYTHGEGYSMFFMPSMDRVMPGARNRNSSSETAQLNNQANIETRLRILTYVNFFGTSGGPIAGDYEYTITISCLSS